MHCVVRTTQRQFQAWSALFSPCRNILLHMVLQDKKTCVQHRATAVIMVAEMTGAITLVPVIALGVGVAAVVGDRLSPGIYDAYLRDKDAPMLQDPKVSVGAALIADR